MTQQSGLANLKEQIKVRDLQVRSGFKDTPINRLRATLTDWDAYIQPSTTPGWADQTMVRLQFDEGDLEVVKSDTPFTHPNTSIEVRYSENGIRADGQGNGWAFFAKSCERIIPEGQGMDALKGHHLDLEWRDTFYDEEGQVVECLVWGGSAAPNTVVKRQTWILVGADGVNWSGDDGSTGDVTAVATDPAGEDVNVTMANAVDGKNKVDANAALLGIPAVRTTLMNDVVSGAIYDTLVTAGVITVDGEGVYHKVWETAEPGKSG